MWHYALSYTMGFYILREPTNFDSSLWMNANLILIFPEEIFFCAKCYEVILFHINHNEDWVFVLEALKIMNREVLFWKNPSKNSRSWMTRLVIIQCNSWILPFVHIHLLLADCIRFRATYYFAVLQSFTVLQFGNTQMEKFQSRCEYLNFHQKAFGVYFREENVTYSCKESVQEFFASASVWKYLS